MNSDLDHLVIVADTLDQGSAWCEATFGVAPQPGGRHPLMGTHNRLLRIDSPAFGQAYLEILAIDPDAPPPGRARWFGLDEPGLQAAVRVQPVLAHVVLRTPNIEMMRWGLINVGVQPGNTLAVSRETAAGPLRWRILVRDDGAVPLAGALPTLIEWGGGHPTAALPPSPVALRSVTLGGIGERVQQVLRPRGITVLPDRPALHVALDSPRGLVVLRTA